jgi:hypothetical protein
VSDDPTSDDIVAWVKEMDDRGIRLFGNRVVSPDEATTAQVRDGEVLLADGAAPPPGRPGARRRAA